eukprot:Pgem_evm1s6245
MFFKLKTLTAAFAVVSTARAAVENLDEVNNIFEFGFKGIENVDAGPLVKQFRQNFESEFDDNLYSSIIPYI